LGTRTIREHRQPTFSLSLDSGSIGFQLSRAVLPAWP